MCGLRIGTRGSMLAVTQSEWVADQLRGLDADLEIELVTIKTQGDKILDQALSKVGGKGLFVTEIENALLAGEVDLAVHSLKDVPTDQLAGLTLAAFPERVDPRDVLVSRDGRGLKELPEGASIGTSSLRRAAQLRHVRPDLRFIPIRGNVDTRVRKMRERVADAIILAAAGLIRLGRDDLIAERLSADLCVPAAGQGILCIEARENDASTLRLVKALDCPGSRACADAERHVVASLGGSCQVPIGALAEVEGDSLTLRAVVSDLQGERLLRASARGSADDPKLVAADAVEQLRSQGADELLREIISAVESE